MLFYPNLLKMLEKSKRIREIGRLSGRSMGRCADSATAILPRLRGRAMGGGAVARSALHVIGVLFVTRRGEALNAPQYLPPCGGGRERSEREGALQHTLLERKVPLPTRFARRPPPQGAV